MRQAVSIERSLLAGSKTEDDVGSKLTSLGNRLWRMSLGALQIIGFGFLSTFGFWPALAFLVYLSMT
ncbi:MAG: hypothetical protein C0619_05880 [Desulfuromonas sp.]|nr:MAG: hypothetical protein C0619_05880 [Desulfuromonas sp.]